jgi:hypothetical protein
MNNEGNFDFGHVGAESVKLSLKNKKMLDNRNF